MNAIYWVLGMAVFWVIIGPLLIIWGLNTLFPVLAIPYSLETWAAVNLVRWAIQAKVEVVKKS